MAYPLEPGGAVPHKFIVQDHGTCENCHEKDVDLCCIPGYMWLCESCFGDLDWCDICGEAFVDGAVEFIVTSDGRYVCPYCAEAYGLGEEE